MSLYPRCPDGPPGRTPRERIMGRCLPGEVAGGPVERLEAGQTLWAHDVTAGEWTPVTVVAGADGPALVPDGPTRLVGPTLSAQAYDDLVIIARSLVGRGRAPDAADGTTLAKRMTERFAFGWMAARDREREVARTAPLPIEGLA